jgi:hypothetical protein
VQLAHPLPFDLDETNLAEHRRLDPMWQDWQRVAQRCAAIAAEINVLPDMLSARPKAARFVPFTGGARRRLA